MREIRIGLLGLGTVGSGVVKTLRLQEKKLSSRLGGQLKIVKVLVRNQDKERSVSIDPSLLTTKFEEVLDQNLDLLIEVMGGVHPAIDYIKAAFEQGVPVVTANKELLAKNGEELIRLANQHQVPFYYEASVAGAIPILSVMRHFLQSNDISSIQGILNGTSNFILSQMGKYGKSYEQVLQEAQDLGYAEADPTSDVEGYDALYKLYILSQLAYGKAPSLGQIKRQGISSISKLEMELIKELGFCLKLMAQAEKREDQLFLSVSPTLLALDHPLSQVQDASNGVMLKGNIAGDLLLTGLGAGEFPTASAVVEDLAFLLSHKFEAQNEWHTVETDAQFNEEDADAHFIYFSTEQPAETALYQVLESLDEEGIQVVQVKDINEGERTHIGLLCQPVGSKQNSMLQKKWNLQAKLYPVLGIHFINEGGNLSARSKQAVNH